MRIKILVFCLLLICIIPIETREPQMTIADILYHHTKAFGDQEILKKIQTMKLVGTYSSFGCEYPIIISRKRPNLCQIEIHLDNKRDICFYDGQKAWQRTKKGDIKIENPIYFCTLLAFSNFDILSDYKSSGIKIKLLGKEVIEGKLTYNLQLIFSSGNIENWYIDCSTYHLLGVAGSTQWYGGEQAKKTILYMDYKPINRIYLPHYFFCDITTFSSEVEIREIEINPNLEPGLFKRRST